MAVDETIVNFITTPPRNGLVLAATTTTNTPSPRGQSVRKAKVCERPKCATTRVSVED